LGFAGLANMACADGNAFTPLNFDDATYITPVKTTATSASDEAKPALQVIKSEYLNESGALSSGNNNIQNALSELDSAQIDIRNELLACKAKYTDTDAQYRLIKNERAILKKQVNDIERRIKELDKAKAKIRANVI